MSYYGGRLQQYEVGDEGENDRPEDYSDERGYGQRGGGYGDEGGYGREGSYDEPSGDVEEPFVQLNLKSEEFGGLVGNLAGDFLKSRLGGGGGEGGGGGGAMADAASHFLGGGGGGGKSNDIGDILGSLAGQLIKGGGGGGGGGGRGGGGAGDLAGDLLGNIISAAGKKGGGGGGGNAGNIATDLIGSLIGGGGKGGSGTGGGGGGGGIDIGSLIGQVIGGGGKKGGGGGGGDYPDGGKGGGGGGAGNIEGILGNLIKGQDIGKILGGIIAGSGGNANRGTAGGDVGGSNIAVNQLKGGLIETFSNLIGIGAHKFFGIDQNTGRILGAIAGNVLFNLGGKDNKLGDIGKAILDNIISGKFKRKVEPYVPPEPSPIPRPPPSPYVPSEPSKVGTDFYHLRDECLKSKTLYEDPDFPAEYSSLFFSGERPEYRIQWQRPGEICKEPQLFIEGHSRFDVIQGKLGDCWLLAATACLTLRDELFYRVCPPDQSFTENYAGIFHFQFWHYGKWVDVVIDDRLPCSNGELLYMHSAEHTEFWSALLEKAYAKLHGSYEALKGGTTSEALEDFTGGLTEFVDLQTPPQNLMQMMFTAFERGSLLACSIEADPRQFEARLPNGLVKGHAYSITGMTTVNSPAGKTPLLRVRNPWGNAQEWNGAWSDDSYEWRSVSQEEKDRIGLKFDHDGEAWMTFYDFSRCYEKLEICHLGPEIMDEIEQMTGARVNRAQWMTSTVDETWERGRSAGGCRNFLKTFAMNPQISFSLASPDRGDSDGLCTIIVGLLQKYRRELRSKGLDMLPIGFAVYESQGGGRLNTNYFAQSKAIARSPVFINLREICGRFRLPPGEYIVVPSTFEPDNQGDFMLRLFAQSESGLSAQTL